MNGFGVEAVVGSIVQWNVEKVQNMYQAFHNAMAHDHSTSVHLCWSMDAVNIGTLSEVTCGSSLVQWDCPCFTPDFMQAVNAECTLPTPTCICPDESATCFSQVQQANPNATNIYYVDLQNVDSQSNTSFPVEWDCEGKPACIYKQNLP